MAQRRKFQCFKCGCCCTGDQSEFEELEPLTDRKGRCRYFDSDTRLCQIYDNRPSVCDMEQVFASYAGTLTWDDFVFTNMLNCVMLRYLQDYPEPEESPFYGRQEEIAQKVMANNVEANIEKIRERQREKEEKEREKAKKKKEDMQAPSI